MRILHFCPLPLFSGLEQYALTLARMQRDLGHEIGFVVLKGSMLEQECAKIGMKTHVVDFPHDAGVMGPALQYKALLSSQPGLDVIHLHTTPDIKRIGAANLMLGLMLGGRRGRKPKIVQQNHIWISHGKHDPIHWLAYKAIDEVWCSSEPARRDILKYLPLSEPKVHIIKYGRDLRVEAHWLSRAEARADLQLPADATVIGAIARIDKAKGVWELINGVLEHLKSDPNLYLVIIGGPTLSDPKAIAYSEQVDSFVKGLPEELRSRLRLTGNIPDAARLLRAFDIYAQVSYKETFSLALLDAQLAGLPVLGTRSGGTPEVVREGQTGWLCEPENSESLSAAAGKALHDRAQWPLLGAAARERVKREFDIDVVLKEILNRYQIQN